MQADGVLYTDTDLEMMSLAEREAYARRMVEEGTEAIRERVRGNPAPVLSPPEGGVVSGVGLVTAPGQAAPDPELFDRAALYDFSDYRTEVYRMPNGRKVWVHPISQRQKIDANRRVLAYLRAHGHLKAPESATQALAQKQEVELESLFVGQVWTTIYCARQGPEPQAKRVFQDGDADALLANAGWSDAIEGIATRAEALANGKEEARIQTEILTDFFGVMGRSLGILSSQLSAVLPDCSDSTRDLVAETAGILDDCGSSALVMTRRWQQVGKMTPGEVGALAAVFRLPAEEE